MSSYLKLVTTSLPAPPGFHCRRPLQLREEAIGVSPVLPSHTQSAVGLAIDSALGLTRRYGRQ